METREAFKPKTQEELSKLSYDGLKRYMSLLRKETKRLKAEIAMFKKQAEEERLKTAEIRGELKVWQELNAKEIIRVGWGDLTEEELQWVMKDDNYHKYWPYFKPSQRQIKEKYAELMKKEVDDTLDRKFAADPRMEVPSAWVDREGNYFGVDVAEHEKWAHEYMVKKFGLDETLSKTSDVGCYAYEFLEKSGWVRVMKWPGCDVNFTLPRLLSSGQKETLSRYCEIYNIKLPFETDFF
jgi:hypothetical protein